MYRSPVYAPLCSYMYCTPVYKIMQVSRIAPLCTCMTSLSCAIAVACATGVCGMALEHSLTASAIHFPLPFTAPLTDVAPLAPENTPRVGI